MAPVIFIAGKDNVVRAEKFPIEDESIPLIGTLDMRVISPFILQLKCSSNSQGFPENFDPEGADILQVTDKNTL